MRPEHLESRAVMSMMGDVPCSAHTIPQLLDEVRDLLHNTRAQPRSILCTNAHIFNLACHDPMLRDALKSARIVAADGISIVWFSRLFGKPIPERCNMTEAFTAFLDSSAFPTCRSVLVGLMPEEGRAAACAMEARSNHLNITGVCSGYLNEQEYRDYFESLEGIDMILVGMGTPRTERICQIASQACPQAVVWGIGAGTIRIFSGSMLEAPRIMRRWGLQWLHRLCAEPRLLWRRYLVGNPLFVLRVLKLGLRPSRNGTPEKKAYESGVDS